MRHAALLALFAFVVSLGTRAEAKPKMPSESKQKALAEETLMKFNEALQEEDFTSFHAYTAKFWQDQITPAELKNVFQEFINQDIDIKGIKDVKLRFDIPSSIDSDGWLSMTGHYNTRPSQVAFELQYLQESGKWKLVGINVQVFPPDEMVPFESVLKAMAKETMIDFGDAVKKGHFRDFHENIAKFWQDQITPKQLKDAFQVFIDKDIDLSNVKGSEAAIDPGAHIDENGWLTFNGHFPTKPYQVNFELQYIWETDAWKLVSINVNM